MPSPPATCSPIAADDGRWFRAVADYTNDWESWHGPDGRLVAVSSKKEQIVAYSFNPEPTAKEELKATMLADGFKGNDLVVTKAGHIYVTHPGWDGKSPSQVWHISPSGEKKVVDTGLKFSNGITVSPDQTLLYVADSAFSHGADLPRHIRVFEVRDDNTVRNGRVFCETDVGLPDGFRLDEKGNVWTSAGDGVHCFSPSGVLLGKILTPDVVANVEFGGPRRNRLFICATQSVHVLYLAVNGAIRR